MFTEAEGLQIRRRVAQLENQVAFLYQHLGIPLPQDQSPTEDPHLIELIRTGKKMDAISLVREKNAIGLAEAKQMVEELQRKMGG